MASAGGIWAPAALRLFRVAVTKTAKMVRTKLAAASRPVQSELSHIPIRSSPTGRQPIHPAALLRQQRRSGRWYSSATYQNINNTFRRYISSASHAGPAPKFNRANFPKSNIAQRISQFTGRTPFASTLRPNLTGGAFPRTAGGYSIGGGARYFSHTPAAPAQVMQNVSQAVRAFWLSGHRARYDGVGPRGDKRYRTVSALEDETHHLMSNLPRSTPGSFIDFYLSPTVTALSPLAAAFPYPSPVAGLKKETVIAATLNTDGLLDTLSVDFARALKDLSAIFTDLKKLAILGDLPILLEKPNVLRVRFPGVDAKTVVALCDDIGIQRGMVGQDDDFDLSLGVPVALRFPFAPDCPGEKTITSPGGSLRSVMSQEVDDAFFEEMEENPWLSDVEGYESLSPPISSGEHCSEDFEGLEGIYRFLEECDRAKQRTF